MREPGLVLGVQDDMKVLGFCVLGLGLGRPLLVASERTVPFIFFGGDT